MSEVEQGVRGDDRPRVRKSAAGVRTEDVQHPLDRQALAALQKVPGFDDVIRFIFEKGFEKIFRIQNLSSAVRVGTGHFPELYALYQGCVQRLGVHPEPPLYLRSGPLNAYTSGVEEPFIVLTTSMVNCASPAELEYVIGHELGHIRCQHVLYNTLAHNLALIVQLLPFGGRVVSTALQVALAEWQRRAELSCDRFGLLAVQAHEPGLRLMVKLAGAPYALYDKIDTAAFLAQYEEFQKLDQDGLSFLYRLMMEMELTHPWLVERAALLKQWSDAGELDRLLAGAPIEGLPPGSPVRTWSTPSRTCACGAALDPAARYCAACGASSSAAVITAPCPACGHACVPTDTFCENCGTKLGAS